MGIPGLLKELGKGERIALSRLAVEFLERNRRPLRVAIDIAIWQFQNQAGQGGHNPALRTFYYRLVRLLALPIHPFFVYDGPNKPLAKRNKVVSRYAGTSVQNETSKGLLRLFRFPYHTAPGEAEAECAMLQREGIVDAVMSQDVDAIMWGSKMTLRDWSQEGTRGNKAPTHVNVLREEQLKSDTGLDADGMILVALLSGGDYGPEGIPGFGSGLACEIARAQFGADLLDIIRRNSRHELTEWRERLNYELQTNESGYFKTRHKTIKIPESFPDEKILDLYTNPAVSEKQQLVKLQDCLQQTWDEAIDIDALREYVGHTFNWQYKGGVCKFIRSLSSPLLAQRLLRGQNNTTIKFSDAIVGRQQHFNTDGMPELRLAIIPADVVGLDIDAEADNPEDIEAEDDIGFMIDELDGENQETAATQAKSKRKAAPWDPRNIEKVWIPESIVKLGIPDLVEDWEQRERDARSNPKQFLTNRARKLNASKSITVPAKINPIQSYFGVTKAPPSLIPGQPVEQTITKEKPIIPQASNPPGYRRALSTSPTRRRVKPTLPPTIPDLTNVNPFSLSMQARPMTTTATGSIKSVSTTRSSFQNDSTIIPTKPPTRKRTPFQKSKTLPASLHHQEPILISSSPIQLPPPRPRTEVQPTSEENNSIPRSRSSSCSSSSSLPSPSALFKSTPFAFPGSKNPLRPVTDAERETSKRMKKKIMVVSRSSLKGTWREVLGDDMGRDTGIEEVSLIDMTDE